MENNNKKSFVAAEVEIKTGFSPLTIKELVAEGVKEVTINAMGRIVVNKGVKLVMWEAPATPAGKLAAQRAILAAGLRMSGRGVLPAALPKQPAAAPKAAPAKPAAPVITEAEWEAARDAKDAQKTQEYLDMLGDFAEEAKEAAKQEKKVKREPKTRAPKAK